MAFGFAGASGTGKTTLMKEVAKLRGYPIVPSMSRQVAAELGLDAGTPMLWEDRMAFQELLLTRQDIAWKEASESGRGTFWSDRTPIDMAAYVLAEMGMPAENEVDVDLEARIAAYIDRCYHVTAKHFGLIMLVPTGIPYRDEAGRPPKSYPYQFHIQMLISGMLDSLQSGTWLYRMPARVADLTDRVDLVAKAHDQFVEAYRAQITQKNKLH